MAKFLSQIVSDIRGSINGITFSRNSSGGYARQKVSPVNPNNGKQVQRRAIFGELSSEWRSLTDAQRQSWKELASANPTTDSLGQTVVLTGLQFYQRLNTNLSVIGQPRIADAPLAPAFPDVQVTRYAQTYDLAFNEMNPADVEAVGLTTPVTGFTMVIYATNLISQGRSFIRQSELKLIGVIPNPTVDLMESFPEAPASPFLQVYSYDQPVGEYKYGYQIDLIHTATGFRQRIGRTTDIIEVVDTP